MTAIRTGLTGEQDSDMAASFLWLFWKDASKAMLGQGATVRRVLWNQRKITQWQ